MLRGGKDSGFSGAHFPTLRVRIAASPCQPADETCTARNAGRTIWQCTTQICRASWRSHLAAKDMPRHRAWQRADLRYPHILYISTTVSRRGRAYAKKLSCLWAFFEPSSLEGAVFSWRRGGASESWDRCTGVEKCCVMRYCALSL